MSDDKKQKKYEPPMVKEIGGVFEQAMGVTNCATGSFFSTDPCRTGATPAGGCRGGALDQACAGGGSDQAGCSRGIGVTGGGCTAGPRGG